jgi:hypothetical protein
MMKGSALHVFLRDPGGRPQVPILDTGCFYERGKMTMYFNDRLHLQPSFCQALLDKHEYNDHFVVMMNIVYDTYCIALQFLLYDTERNMSIAFS